MVGLIPFEATLSKPEVELDKQIDVDMTEIGKSLPSTMKIKLIYEGLSFWTETSPDQVSRGDLTLFEVAPQQLMSDAISFICGQYHVDMEDVIMWYKGEEVDVNASFDKLALPGDDAIYWSLCSSLEVERKGWEESESRDIAAEYAEMYAEMYPAK